MFRTMAIKCEIKLTCQPKCRLLEFKFWDEQTPHAGPPTCAAVTEVDYGATRKGAVLFRNTSALRTLIAFLLEASASKDPLTFRLTEGRGHAAKTLAAAFDKETLANSKRPWPQVLFVQPTALKPVLKLHGLFDFSCRWAGNRFSFALMPCWENADLEVEVDGWRLEKEEYPEWAAKLAPSLSTAPLAVRAGFGMDGVGRAPSTAIIPFGQFMHELHDAPLEFAKRIAMLPLPLASDMADFPALELERCARLIAEIATQNHERGFYRDAASAHALAAELFAYSKNEEQAGWCLLCALSSLRPLGAHAQARLITFKVLSLLESKPLLAACFGAHLLSELGAFCYNRGERTNALMLCQASDECSHHDSSSHCRGGGRRRFVHNSPHFNARRLGQAAGERSFKEGRSMLLDVCRQFQNEGDSYGYANTLFSIVELYSYHNRPGEALDFLDEHESSFPLGSKWISEIAPAAKGVLLAKRGHDASAIPLLRQSFLGMKKLNICPSLTPSGPSPLDSPDLALLALRPNDPVVTRYGRLRVRGPMPFKAEEFRHIVDVVTHR